MTDPVALSFDDRALAARVEALPTDAVDRLAFGVVRVDADGVVRFYSRAEREQSQSGSLPRVGLDFFTAVAPCMNTAEFRGRIEQALAAGQLDLEFGWVGDFGDANRELRIRVQSARAGGYWIFLQRA